MPETEATYDAQLASFIRVAKEDIEKVVSAGGVAYLYSGIYVEVDAQLNSVQPALGLPLSELASWGANAWEVVGVVPRTYSGTESYLAKSRMTLRDWGGVKTEQKVASSGNVIGAYVLMKLPITERSISHQGPLIDQSLQFNFESSFGEIPQS